MMMLSLILWMPAWAQAGDHLPTGTRINLSATVSSQLPNDELLITYRVEKEGVDAAKVRGYVNRVSKSVQQRLKQERGLALKTISRNMQPVWKYPKNSQRIRTGWRMTQTGQIRTKRMDHVSDWLDAIEGAGAHLSGLNFRISDSASKQGQDALRLQAIASFRAKAAVIAHGLNAASFRIIRLNTSSASPRPLVYRGEMAMMAKAAADAPALSAGEGKLSVTVSGEIEVPFTDFPAQ